MIKIKKTKNEKLKIAFPYNQETIQKIKTIKGYWWHKEGKLYYIVNNINSIISIIKRLK